MHPPKVLVVASPIYADRGGVIGFMQSLPFHTPVMTPDETCFAEDDIGMNAFIVGLCGMLVLPVRKVPEDRLEDAVKFVDRVVLFYEPPSDHDRIKSVREWAIAHDKPLELFMVGQDGHSREVPIKYPEREPEPIQTPPAIIAPPPPKPESTNPARVRAMAMVSSLPDFKKGLVNRK